MRSAWLSAVILMLSSILGCAPGTAPALEPVEFTVAPATDVPYSESPVEPTVRVSPRQMEITGVISTADPCHDISGQLVRGGQLLMLRVTAKPRGEGGCIAVIGTFRYTAIIRDLSAGKYQLTVAHLYERCCWPNKEVLSAEVNVP